MKTIEVRVKVTDDTTPEDMLIIGEHIKDLIYDEEGGAIEDVTYEVNYNFNE